MVIKRRQFLKQATLGVSASIAAYSTALYIPARCFGANQRVRVAEVGTGNQGNFHLKNYLKLDGVEIAALADADLNRATATQKRIQSQNGGTPKVVQDARKLFDDKSIDMVSVATCDHWHSLMAIWAAQAGKHVYVEKPCSQNLREGRILALTAAKYNVMVQHGTQRRHQDIFRLNGAAWASGKYGKPTAMHAFAHRPRNPIAWADDCEVPEGVDWNLWTGPAALVPFNPNRFGYNWHHFWNTGTGEIGNNGVHFFDQARIALAFLKPGIKHPQNVHFFGTRIVDAPKRQFKDQGETPTVQIGSYDFDGIPMVFESCNLKGKDWVPYETLRLHTDQGYIENGWFYPDNKGEKVRVEAEYTPPYPGGQFGNLVSAIQNGKPNEINAPIAEGHYSTSVCHLGNIAYRLGKPASLSQCRSAMLDHPIMQETLDRVLGNIRNIFSTLNIENEIPWQLGEKISINNETEQFDGNDAANALLSRQARAPFVVPENV
ncbi:MAG: Gfo/Idh/MocA family oxidoreductase [Planctomycetia bacterium]|nr:Gfo/Idh/MocA family oxidoreductase [Planctomycetia bacterium]